MMEFVRSHICMIYRFKPFKTVAEYLVSGVISTNLIKREFHQVAVLNGRFR